ncbi:MAG: hypothetical protein K2Z81_04235 [Cyanobacteria bacterium]|nr:hypothetical protein [Cyanobacteriota bacterium]
MIVILGLLGILAGAVSGGLTMAFHAVRWNLEPGFGDHAPGKGFVTGSGIVVGAILGGVFTIVSGNNFDSSFVSFLALWASASIFPLGAALAHFLVQMGKAAIDYFQAVAEATAKQGASKPASVEERVKS